MLLSEFDYHLPNDLIARRPLSDRSAARLLHLDRNSGALEDRGFREFAEILRPDDLLVLNDTKVLPARLYGHRSGSRAHRLSPENPASAQFLHGRV